MISGEVLKWRNGLRLVIRRRYLPALRVSTGFCLTRPGEAFLKELTPFVKNLQNDILVGLNKVEREEFLRLAAKIAAQGNDLSSVPLILR